MQLTNHVWQCDNPTPPPTPVSGRQQKEGFDRVLDLIVQKFGKHLWHTIIDSDFPLVIKRAKQHKDVWGKM